ncbi:cysteine hydrolase family protein [Reyranella soli]|uniref:Isochorismatase n=1 Tax=Reyranella soli TaxID=1230389 RepID=A0A512N6T6_9HYPH|nr:isochorismatase family cysteine hydrolase [Reyranella soli]GEP54623.1 isochorismatase [Reyranella soli]
MLARKYAEDRTGLLLIDAFNDFLSEGGKLWPRVQPAAETADLLGHLRTLLGIVRRAGLAVFHVPHRRWREGDFDRWKHPTPWQLEIDREGLFAHGTWGGDWHADLAPQPGDVIVQEHWGHDGFHSTDLDLQLRQRGIENIIVAGMALDRCVAATARIGVELGYHVTLVRDATAMLAPEDAEPGSEGPPIAHVIVTTQELAAALGQP